MKWWKPTLVVTDYLQIYKVICSPDHRHVEPCTQLCPASWTAILITLKNIPKRYFSETLADSPFFLKWHSCRQFVNAYLILVLEQKVGGPKSALARLTSQPWSGNRSSWSRPTCFNRYCSHSNLWVITHAVFQTKKYTSYIFSTISLVAALYTGDTWDMLPTSAWQFTFMNRKDRLIILQLNKIILITEHPEASQ